MTVMKLAYKCTIPGKEVNSLGAAKGAFLFDLMDLGALTVLSELFIDNKESGLVTTDANVKYSAPVYAFEFVEVYAEIINITSSTITAKVELYKKSSKSKDWTLATSGEFSFSLVRKDNGSLQRIPRDVINEIKR